MNGGRSFANQLVMIDHFPRLVLLQMVFLPMRYPSHGALLPFEQHMCVCPQRMGTIIPLP
jgi:hypothetical protein